MPKSAASHEENRRKVCIACFQKGSSLTPIRGHTLIERIHRFYIENYDEGDIRLPSAICGRCRNLLTRIEKGEKPLTELPEPFDFSQVLPPPISTRSNPETTNCSCNLCQVARGNPINLGLGKKYTSQLPFTLGRPPNPESAHLLSPRPVRVCKRCWQPIGRGIPHPQPCTMNDARGNLTEVIKTVPRAADIVASDLIQERVSENDPSNIKIGTRGRDITIALPGTSRPTSARALFHDNPVSAEEVGKFQTTVGLSLKQTKKAVNFIRTWKGRKVVEAGTIDKLRVRDRDLSEFFSVTQMDMDSSFKEDQSKVKRCTVYCNDVSGLIDHIMEFRGRHNTDKHLIKFGIDGGGDFLKFCVNIIEDSSGETSSPVSKRAAYSEGAFADQFRDSGVKKLLIIGIVQDVKESYGNLTQVMDALRVDGIDFMAAFDLKLANVYLGLGPHSSKHPCPWCELSRDEFGNPDRVIIHRTIGSIRKNASDYKTAAAAHTRKKTLSAAAYKSCINLPLTPDLPDETRILDILPIMELHLLIGITNRLYDHADKLFCETKGCSIRAKDWSDQLSIRRPPMHSGEFNGPQCVKLLENTSVLEGLFGEAKVGTSGTCLLCAIQSFNAVRKCCFGMLLDPNYKTTIGNFENNYRNLQISITSKCHALFDHVCEFLDSQKATTGLGHWSEQASESVHRDFASLWQSGGYKRDLNHPNYPDKLLQCVVTYNSRHR